jgi:aspartate/methionine/tyrosine aminotransferase
LFLNSPGNPTGWTLTVDEQKAILDFCRARGIWIVADEVYARFVYDRPAAPSFLAIATPEDRLVVVNTFSKNWAMTGWRVGWLQAPRALGPAIERIIQINSSGTPAFLQRGCVAALDEGDAFIAQQVAEARAGRDLAITMLGEIPGLHFEVPTGAFYFFFAVEGMTDSALTVRRMIDEARVGFAPGSAFGPGGEGHLRLCYLKDPATLREALARFQGWMKQSRPS